MVRGPVISPPRCRQRGFSLLELMAVLAIMAIMLGGAIELFDSLVKGQRVRSTSFELYSALTVARSEALKRGSNVTITPVSGNWANGWNITNSAGNPLKSQGAFEGATITTTPSALANVVFTRNGRPTASPSFQVEVTSSYQRCVRLDLSGSPRTVTGACS